MVVKKLFVLYWWFVGLGVLLLVLMFELIVVIEFGCVCCGFVVDV